jgi:predicted patatin/cPLA2 family phospholipase
MVYVWTVAWPIPFPYEYAQANGYDKIVVIRTRERTYRKNATSAVLRRAYQQAFSNYPAFVETAIGRPEMYNRQAEQLQNLEAAGKTFVIAPAQPVTVGRLERDTDKLEALHATGMADAQAQLNCDANLPQRLIIEKADWKFSSRPFCVH